MSTRDKILNNVRQSKPAFAALAASLQFHDDGWSFDNFCNAVKHNGGQVIEADDTREIISFISKYYPSTVKLASNLITATIDVDDDTAKSELNLVEVSVLKAEIGVAENGALWLTEKNMINRCLPFITQHLIVAVDKNSIVGNMHEAYNRIKLDDYGVFIAGPSKTADIEQSLVIGAHGAKTHTVFVIS